MVKIGKIGILVLFSFCLCIAKQGDAAAYLLGSGDVISISVYGYDELSLPELTVPPDGEISIPLAGEIEASGISTVELKQKISTKLETYLKNPLVTVNVVRRQPIKVNILGEVNHPGYYSVERGKTLLDALGMAAGWTKDASKKNVFYIRRGETKSTPIQVNLLKMLNEGDFSQNYILQDGDIVYLSSNGRIDITRDVLPFIYPFYLFHHWEKTP